MKRIDVETEEELCGDEFLANGNLVIENVEGFGDDLIKLKSNGFTVYCSAKKLRKALKIFKKDES